MVARRWNKRKHARARIHTATDGHSQSQTRAQIRYLYSYGAQDPLEYIAKARVFPLLFASFPLADNRHSVCSCKVWRWMSMGGEM
jgi:hypothetical protein